MYFAIGFIMLNKKTIASKLLALALVFAIIEIADAATPEAKETKPQTNQEKKIQEKKQEKKQERKLAKTSAKLIAAKPLFESKVLSAMIDAEISKKIKEEKAILKKKIKAFFVPKWLLGKGKEPGGIQCLYDKKYREGTWMCICLGTFNIMTGVMVMLVYLKEIFEVADSGK